MPAPAAIRSMRSALFIVSPSGPLCLKKCGGEEHSLSLDTRRHYLAPHREESQLWKSWKSAPDAFFGVARDLPNSMVALPGTKKKPFPAPVSSGKRPSRRENSSES